MSDFQTKNFDLPDLRKQLSPSKPNLVARAQQALFKAKAEIHFHRSRLLMLGQRFLILSSTTILIVIALNNSFTYQSSGSSEIFDNVSDFARNLTSPDTHEINFIGAVLPSPQITKSLEKSFLDRPLFSITDDEIAKVISADPWLKLVSVTKELSGNLDLILERKVAEAIWQQQHELYFIDKAGQIIAQADSLETSGNGKPLYHLVGEGANYRVAELEELLSLTPELGEHIKSFTLVSRRRWDIALANQITIQLAADNPQGSLSIMQQLLKTDLLEQHNLTLDLRNRDRVVTSFN